MFSSLYKIRVEAGIQFNQAVVPLYDENRDNPVTGDGSRSVFYTEHAPLVDANDDGETDVDDVVVRVNGSAVTVSAIDATQGQLTLASAPADDAILDVNYSWSSHSDTQVGIYQARANGEILGVVGSVYTLPLSDNPEWENSPAQAMLAGMETTLAAAYLLMTIYTEENSGMWQQGKDMMISVKSLLSDIKKGKIKLFDADEVELASYGVEVPNGYPNNSTPDDEDYAFKKAQII